MYICVLSYLYSYSHFIYIPSPSPSPCVAVLGRSMIKRLPLTAFTYKLAATDFKDYGGRFKAVSNKVSEYRVSTECVQSE